ncbi:hypothetical protein [Sphingobacterium lactis]|uniref:hypothetical protein n=1 Tax=Sphingobacterium lactis TaxID=797291 RepID=UPI003DA46A33
MSQFENFKKDILLYYEEELAKGTLPEPLMMPTPAGLRDYALALSASEMTPDDHRVFKTFFDLEKKYDSLSEAIDRSDRDRLIPVQRFLMRTTISPREGVVKLAAILVDYPNRPFRIDAEARKITSPTEPPAEPIVGEPSVGIPKHKKIYLLILAGAVVVLGIALALNLANPPKSCMVWTGERYEKVDCTVKLASGNPIIPLDEDKLAHFQKIMRTDTLTRWSAGKIWYAQINRKVEFYTEAGTHPVKTDRGLRLATEYMIHKYAGRNSTTPTKGE